MLIKEGKDNEKFESLPDKKASWIAYRILHNPFYYWLALILAVALMLVAFFEQPSATSAQEENATSAQDEKKKRGEQIVCIYFCGVLIKLSFHH